MRGKWLSTRLPAKGAGNVASKEGAPQGYGASRETTKEKHESSQRDFTPCETDGLVLPAHSAHCLGQALPMTPRRPPPGRQENRRGREGVSGVCQLEQAALLDAGVLSRSPEGRVEFPFDRIKVEFLLQAA